MSPLDNLLIINRQVVITRDCIRVMVGGWVAVPDEGSLLQLFFASLICELSAVGDGVCWSTTLDTTAVLPTALVVVLVLVVFVGDVLEMTASLSFSLAAAPQSLTLMLSDVSVWVLVLHATRVEDELTLPSICWVEITLLFQHFILVVYNFLCLLFYGTVCSKLNLSLDKNIANLTHCILT